MNRVKTGLAAICLLSLTLTACHGRGGGLQEVRWVNQSDPQDVMQFKLRSLSLLGQLHATIIATKLQGTYVHRKGDTVVSEGTLTLDSSTYLLKSSEGKEQRFEVDKPGVMKDKDGALWQLDTQKRLAVLREW